MVPAGVHDACPGGSMSRNLAKNHGEAFRALRAIQAHVNPHTCGKKMRQLWHQYRYGTCPTSRPVSHIKPCCKTLHHHRLHHHQQHQQCDQAWVACPRCCFSLNSTNCLVMLPCLNGPFCVLSMTRIQTTFTMHIYTSSVLTFVSRVVLQLLCRDHRLLCASSLAARHSSSAASTTNQPQHKH